MTSRYARQDLIDWLSREDVSSSRVLVIGAGAIGNELLKNLALLGVGEIHVHDLDRIEQHNLTRSVLFREKDIGSAKAVIAAKRTRELDPNVKVVAHVGDFWDKVSIESLKGFDWIACCVDNFEARIRCNTLAFIAGTNFINVGIDSRHCVVETFPFARSKSVGCY
jgi:molybdopterin/thiamine biosynthesis adenylyltransferase